MRGDGGNRTRVRAGVDENIYMLSPAIEFNYQLAAGQAAW